MSEEHIRLSIIQFCQGLTPGQQGVFLTNMTNWIQEQYNRYNAKLHANWVELVDNEPEPAQVEEKNDTLPE